MSSITVTLDDSISPNERELLEMQLKLNQHIPQILLTKIRDLKNVYYREHLKRFYESYNEVEFREILGEYEIISQTVIEIFRDSFPDPFEQVIQNSIDSARSHLMSNRVVKERFIHPFQMFLVGTVIIDSLYDKFTSYYSKELCKEMISSIENSWLVASMLHDRDKPLKQIRQIIKLEYDEIKFIIPNHEAHIHKLVSLYIHLKNGRPLEEWNNQEIDPAHPLIEVFKQFNESENHGVTGAIQTLNHIYEKVDPELVNPGLVQAALAIALHDSKLYHTLIKDSLLPIKIRHLPVPCLLLYCDEIQEWNRYSKIDIESRLLNLDIKNNEIICSLGFKTNGQARRKLEQIERIEKSVDCEGDLYFSLSTKVCAGK